MTAEEFAEWRAFERVEGPFGDRRLDSLAALICTTVANAWRGKRKPYELKDFILQWGKKSGVGRGGMLTRVEDQLAIFRGLAALSARQAQRRKERAAPRAATATTERARVRLDRNQRG